MDRMAHRESAEIIPFPLNRAGHDKSRSFWSRIEEEAAKHPCFESWYHQEAIDEETVQGGLKN